MTDLSIVYVNWNSLDYLRKSIASVYEHTHEISFEIIVVDNASPETGVESLEELFAGINIIKSSKNLGFARANNLGFKASTGKYVLLLNPDTLLIESSLDVMLKHIQLLPDAGIVGCKLLNSDRSVQLTSIQKFPNILNQVVDAEYMLLRWPRFPLWNIGPLFCSDVKLTKAEVISGACMLLRHEVFEKVGMFSEDYFMYAEDLDLNYKVRKAGFTNYYVGETAIIHHGGRSSSRQQVSQWATIMKYKAMLTYFRKTRGRSYELLYRASIGIVALCRLLLLALAFPVGGRLFQKDSLHVASKKWRAVLAWAVGFSRIAANS
jgi:GT2 family glycosyltransferase